MTTITQVDAFTDRPFSGNPAAVCVLPGPADEGWMRRVAREMNLSETAFLHPEEGGDYALRWFTPAVEVDLCGHATLAAAHVLWELGDLAPDRVARFRTRSGLLSAARVAGGWIEMDFPSDPADEIPPPPELGEALDEWAVRFVGRNRVGDLLVELEDEVAVGSVRPDPARLGRVEARGIIVTAPSAHAGSDFVSRFFAPRVGILEDPVTGSAHCALAPYWSTRLGRRELVARQVSERGGTLRLREAGDRVAIAGRAVTVLRGELIGAAGIFQGGPNDPAPPTPPSHGE